MNPVALIPIAMVLVVIVTITVTAIVQARKVRANLAVLGDKFGFELKTQGRFFKKHRLTGELRGKPAEIFTYTTGSGKSKRIWAAVAVQVKATSGLTFSLGRRMTLFEFVAKLFRKNEAKTGDPVFDRKWVLTTNQPDFMRTALLPEMREKILRLSAGGLASGHFKYALQKLQYAEQGSFSSARLCARIEEAASIVCDLADMVKVGAELRK